MSVERMPHPWFAAAWGAWFGNVVGALLMPDVPRYGLIVLLFFFVLEIPAALLKSGHARDTLSEIATWAIRNTAKTRQFARGWNAVLLWAVLMIAWLLMRTVTHYADSAAMGIVSFALCSIFLWDHFSDPATHG